MGNVSKISKNCILDITESADFFVNISKKKNHKTKYLFCNNFTPANGNIMSSKHSFSDENKFRVCKIKKCTLILLNCIR